jgi:dTDP-4-amino-4,6-dideoxygalactose transaminase
LAAEYDCLLEGPDILRPVSIPDARQVYCLYTIQADDRDQLQRNLATAGIQTAVHYPVPIHLMPAYTDRRYKAGDFPVAEACARTVLSLPLYPHMSSGQVEQVANQISALGRKTNQETLLTRR